MKDPKNLIGKIGYIGDNAESLKVFTNQSKIKIGRGNYKLVYGVPRKRGMLWDF